MNELEYQEIKQVIKDMYFPKASDTEFKAFLFDAQAKGLDPLQKEIIPIMFKGRTTTVVSRDGYVKKAKENPNFLGYRSQPVYENDHFEYSEDNTGFHYEFKTNGFKDRGKLLGAFCHVSMKDPVEDTFALVSYQEVRQNTPVWKSNPTFMTEKVAEVRALKPICNLAGVCSDVELGQNVSGDEEVIDVDTEAEVETQQQTHKKQEHLLDMEIEQPEQPEQQEEDGNMPQYQSVQDVNDYFMDNKTKEGYTAKQLLEIIQQMYENHQINDEIHETLLKQMSNMSPDERYYTEK